MPKYIPEAVKADVTILAAQGRELITELEQLLMETRYVATKY